MKKHLIHFLLVAVLSICSAAAFAQTTVGNIKLINLGNRLTALYNRNTETSCTIL